MNKSKYAQDIKALQLAVQACRLTITALGDDQNRMYAFTPASTEGEITRLKIAADLIESVLPKGELVHCPDMPELKPITTQLAPAPKHS